MSKGANLIAIRYARSLFDEGGVGDDQSKQGRYGEAFEALNKLFGIREASDVIRSPAMPMDVKKNLLNLALDGGGADQSFRNFVAYLLDSKRESLIPQIAKAYEELVAEKRNEKRAKVVSAHKLSEDLITKIEQSLKNIFGKKIIMTSEMDSTLLGGFVVEVGDFHFDCSLRAMVDKVMKSS